MFLFGISLVMIRLNRIEEFNGFSRMQIRSFYHEYILSKKCAALLVLERLKLVECWGKLSRT
jgi:hypothetical protein